MTLAVVHRAHRPCYQKTFFGWVPGEGGELLELGRDLLEAELEDVLEDLGVGWNLVPWRSPDCVVPVCLNHAIDGQIYNVMLG